MIFVPLAEPLPAGRRGRFAVTLVDGGVMLEGQAEVVSSAKTPSVVHGRVGMTIKFVAPDDDSKKLLGELEKARLALKPAAPSVAPRPVELPSDVRPKPPAPGGRVDSMNALAECVVLGDIGSLSRDSEPAIPSAAVGKPSSGPVPSTRQPSGPVSTVGKGSTETLLGGMPAITPAGTPALAAPPRPATPSKPPVVMPPIRPPGSTNPPPLKGEVRAKAPSIPPPVPAIPTPIGHQGSGSVGKGTSLGLPALDRKPAPIDMSQTMRGPAPGVNLSQPAKIDMSQTMRGTRPAAAPLPIAPPPPVIEEPSEKTDISGAPAAPSEDSRKIGRSTSIGVAISASGGFQLPALPEETRDTQEISAVTEIPEPDAPPAKPSITPVVEEASGDWTMTPSDDGPTFEPRVKDVPKGPPTGDWSIALDPSQPDGWSEPSKIEKRPPGELPPGPPVSAVAGERPLDSTDRGGPRAVDEGPKIQIDPTLIEPLAPMPPIDSTGSVPSIQDDGRPSSVMALPPPPIVPMGAMAAGLAQQELGVAETVPQLQALNPAVMPNAYAPAAPIRGDITDANTGFFRDTGGVPSLDHRDSYTAGAMAVQSKKQRNTIIAVAAAALLLIVIIALLATGKKKAKPVEQTVTPPQKVETKAPVATPPPPTHEAVTPPTETPVDAGTQVATAPTTTPTETPPPPTDCIVAVNTVPSGAEISIGDKVLQNTPAKLTLPCGEQTSLTLKKAKYQLYTTKPFKPSAEKQKSFKIALARTTFSVKVASTPPGASVYLGTKSLGITPAVIKVPQFDTSTLKITKDGYQAETQTVAPKNNNLSITVALKKLAKGPAVPSKGAPAKTAPKRK
ncbi:MAG TPA: PEGA domain-containing protein [Kofleriaceae bacterium]